MITLYILLTSKSCLNTPTQTPTLKNNKENISLQETTLKVNQKTTKEDPDLTVKQSYTAIINGEKVTVPIKPSASPNTSKELTSTLTQEIDISPIIKKLQPKWELGVGIGYHKELYIPLSLQRNYKPQKAISVELHLDPKDKKISGTEIMHKWFF